MQDQAYLLFVKVQNGGVRVRKGVDVGFPQACRAVPLNQKVDGQHHIGHGLQQGVSLYQGPNTRSPGGVCCHHCLPGYPDDWLSLGEILGCSEAEPLLPKVCHFNAFHGSTQVFQPSCEGLDSVAPVWESSTH